MTVAEEWRPVAGYEGYEVSDLGRVRCWRPIPSWGPTPAEPRIVKTHLYRNGYSKVCLGLYGGTALVHRLVALAFLGDPLPGQEVAHANGTRADNRLENLRWATRSENLRDRIAHGTHGRTLTKEKVELIRSTYRPGVTTQKQVAAMVGVTQATVSKVFRGQTWKETT